MTRKFTFTILAMLFAIMGPRSVAWGQKITTLAGITSGNNYYIGATTSSTDYYFSANGSSTSTSIAGTAVSTKSDATVLKFTAVTGGWTIQFESGNYLGLKNGKDNGKVQVVEVPVVWTIEEDADKGLLKLHPNDYYLQKNNSSAPFGSYKNTQTDVWLEAAGSTPSAELESIAISGTPTKTTYEAGESFDPAGLVVMGTYDDESTAEITSGITWDVTPNPLTAGTTSVSVTATVDDKSDTKNYDVTVNAIEGDRLTLASTGVSSGYTAWTDKTGSEGVAKYAGQSSNGNNSIQIRNQSPSGIVSTTSGGLIKKVKVDWNTNTANGRSIKIYGSNTAYTGSADVYDSEKRGEELGSIAKGTTELEITGDFAYVGILPVGGAMYLNSITFVWSAPKVLEGIAVKTAPTVVNYAAGEFFNPAGLVITASYDDESTADIAYEGNEDKFSFSPALDVALATTDEQVTITYGGKSCNQTITVNLIKLATPANLQATNVTLTSANLTWGEVANASSYEVKLNGVAKTATTNSLLVENLTESTTYTWTVKAIGDGTTYADSDESEPSEFTTSALPTVAYTVSFNGNEHGTPASESITETSAGAGITLPGCTPNTGYQFVGWATTNTATEADAGVAGATYHPTANITLYAVYNSVYTITWSVNGAPTTEGNPTTSVVEGEGITTLPTAPASISGMAFQGWTATQIATSSATAPTDLFTDAEHAPAITANTTFYAVFAEESEGDVTWNNVTTLAGITEGQYVIINGSFYLTNTTVTNTGPTAGDAPTISNNIIADANVTATMKWSFTSTGTTNQFYVKNSNDDYLYATSANNGVRVSNTSDKWTFAENTSGYFSMKEANNSRYCAKYTNGSDWRSYTSATHENYVNGGKLELYKKTQDITYTYYTNVVVKQLTSISLSGGYPTEFWKGDAFSHDGIIVTAHYSNADDEDVTDKATFTGYDMAAAGEQTVTVTYDTESTTYNITVKTIANTAATAYTVAEAKAIIDAGKDLGTEVYVKGTVSKIVTEWSSQYGNITFDVSADGQTTGNQFQFYRNFKGAENEKWTSAAECPAVGDDVIGIGTMKKYGSTYEFDAGNYIVSLIRFATLSIKDITVEIGKTITPEITTNVPDEYTIAYSVASEDVVKVDNGNLVTVAVGGPATITATLTAEGYKNATTTFTVEVIKALESIAVKTAPTKLKYKEGDKFDPTGLVITATYSDASTGDIAYEENEESFAFEPSLETALTTENTSVTITYAGKKTTQTIEVRALYTYKITWKANGEQFATTEVTEGDALVLPETNPDNVGDMVFQGWINTENYYDAETAPEYIVPSEIIPTGAMTFYAVYAKETSEFQEKEVTYTFTSKSWGDATSSWTSGKDGNSYQNNQGVQVTSGVTGANATSKSEFTEVTKVVVNYCTNEKAGKGTIRVKVGDGTAQSYSVSAPSSGGTTLRNTDDMIFGNETGKVNITVECGTNSIYINSITITSKVGKETISNFCTTITALSGDLSVATTVANKVYYISAEAFVPANATVTINGALINTDHEKLIIEDGGQLIHHNAGVAATVKKNITGYTNAQGNDGYYLIANPTDNATVAHLTDNDYDLYTFNPTQALEWHNEKENNTLTSGIGYLYANSDYVTLEFAGNLRSAADDKTIDLAFYDGGEDGHEFPGFNLVGNPFACNAYVYNNAGEDFTYYTIVGSEITATTGATIPCTGIFVEASGANQQVTFSTEAPEAPASLLSLTVSQNRGNAIDRAIVRFDGSSNLHKFMLNPSHTNLSIAKDGETFAAVSSETKGELPVSFKAETTGTYTISVNTENVTAGYIHLIDNMTGTDVDLLATPSYTFIGSPRDNENRFTVKFEVSYGQDGDEDEHFAYQNGSELVINGEGTLQIFDVLGRVVISEEVHGQTVNVGGLNTGAYIVRLTGESVKTQKIVVR